MKKVFAALLVLMLLPVFALGENQAQGIQLEINGMSVSDEWNGETDSAYKWLAVDVRATNWHTDAVDLRSVLNADLTYEGHYFFDGELIFPSNEIGQLVQEDGVILFKLPLMVAQSLEDAVMTIGVEGSSIVPEISVDFAHSQSHSDRYEGAGFDSPEAAVEAYITSMNDGDLSGMLSTFAVETAIENVDTKAYLERTRLFTSGLTWLYPVINEYSRDLLIVKRLGELAQYLGYQYLTYAWPTEYGVFEESAVVFEGKDEALSAEIEGFLDGFQASEFTAWTGNIDFVEFLSIEQILDSSMIENFLSEQSLKNLERIRIGYGCDELADIIAHIQINGEDYYQFMQCARYGQKWYNLNLKGYAADFVGLSKNVGGLVPSSALEY